MDYKKIQAILNEVKPIVEENKKCRIEKWKNGDFFNIFSILKMETDEVKTHSAFLAELLNILSAIIVKLLPSTPKILIYFLILLTKQLIKCVGSGIF